MFPLRRGTLLGALALLAWALALAWHMWDRGPDPWIDFGRELYVPWRLTEGDALHRDVSWFNGPLSPWWNAAWMALCGVSFDTLQWVNLGVALAASALLFGLVRAATDGYGAAFALALFFPMFAFSQQKAIGNYSFLAPYSHCIVHGFVLSLVTLALLQRAARRTGLSLWALAGVVLGGVFLTKAEVFVAAAAATAAVFALRALRREPWLARAAACGAGSAAALAAAWLGLRQSLSAHDATLALLGTWRYALDPALSSLSFYDEMRGTDAPLASILETLRVIGIAACLLLALLGLARLAPEQARGARRTLLLGALAATGAALVFGLLTELPVEPTLRPLPLALMALAFVALRRTLRGEGAAERERGVAALVFAVFSLSLTAKLGLRVTARDYGFVLAAPGATLVFATLLADLPRALGATALGRARVRATLGGALLGLALAHLHATHVRLERRSITVLDGGDRIRVMPWRGDTLAPLLRELDRIVPYDGTLLVLPEGVMVNYWLRRRAPISVYNFMPPELLMFGEDKILADLEAHPPDVVLLAHKETPEYGDRFFGHGYGEALLGWVQSHYREVTRFGAAPLLSTEWGASILLPRDHP